MYIQINQGLDFYGKMEPKYSEGGHCQITSSDYSWRQVKTDRLIAIRKLTYVLKETVMVL